MNKKTHGEFLKDVYNLLSFENITKKYFEEEE